MGQKGYIYKITNPVNKVYIGQTKNVLNRVKSYSRGYCKSQKLLYNSILKYGWENHRFEVLYTCDIEFLGFWEVYYISTYNSYNYYNSSGLNLTLGGEGCIQLHVNDETRAKMSASAIKRDNTGSKNNRSRLVFNSYNGLFYETIREAAKSINVNEGTLRKKLIGGAPNETGMFLCDTDKPPCNKRRIIHNRKIINIRTGEIYCSTKEVAEILGIRPHLLLKYLKNKLINKTDYRFLDNKNSLLKMYENSKLVLDTTTGIYFYSCKEAAICYNIYYTFLSEKLRGSKKNNTNLKYV